MTNLIRSAQLSNRIKQSDYVAGLERVESDDLPTSYIGQDPATGLSIIQRLGQGEVAIAQNVSTGGISSGQIVHARGTGTQTKIEVTPPSPTIIVPNPKKLEVVFYYFAQVTGGGLADFDLGASDYSTYNDLLTKGKIPRYNQSLTKSELGVSVQITTRGDSPDIKQHEFRLRLSVSRFVTAPSPLFIRSQIKCWSNFKNMRVSREVINFNQIGFNNTISFFSAIGGNPADRSQSGTQNLTNGLWESQFDSLSADNANVGLQNYYFEVIIRASQEFPAPNILYP